MIKPHGLEVGLAQLGIPYATDTAVPSTLLESRAALVVHPSATQLADLLPLLHEAGVAYQPIGGGSNTLLTGTDSAPLRTVLISQKHLRNIAIDRERGQVTAEGGAYTSIVSRLTAQAGLSGLEFAHKIPGTVAGAIATNAGETIQDYAASFEREGVCFDGLAKEVQPVVSSVEVVDANGQVLEIDAEDIGISSKSSPLLDAEDALYLARAKFALTAADLPTIEAARRAIRTGRAAMRKANRARNPYSVGKTLGYSFVPDHPDYNGSSAMELIATTGSLPKEMTIEGMHHSLQTPNIIANTGSGTPDGYLRIADRIQEAVHKEHGVEMPLEVGIIR